jgi:NADH-quinone oxidoreductase subunit I
MAITFGHIFKKKVTLQYPEEKWTLPEYYRGVPVLVLDEDEREKCVACSLCEYICPPRAITLVPTEREGAGREEKIPEVFDIDMLRCIFCGYCEEACPEDAIFLGHNYELADVSRDAFVYSKEQLLVPLGTTHTPGIVRGR